MRNGSIAAMAFDAIQNSVAQAEQSRDPRNGVGEVADNGKHLAIRNSV